MSEKKSKCRRVKSNLLQAEVYVRYPKSRVNKQSVKRYVELRDVETKDGFFQKYVVVDYPITADSVNSYADAADYRTNPDVISQSKNASRQNLGDITGVQQVLNSDMTKLRSLVAQAQDVTKRLEEARKSVDPTTKSNKVEGGEGNGNSL